MAESSIGVTAAIAVVTAVVGFGLGNMHVSHEKNATITDVKQEIATVSVDSSVLPVENSPMRGGANPKAVIMVFTDFKTPQSVTVYRDYLSEIQKMHESKVAVVYKAFPLQQNSDSMNRAKAAMAAHLQSKFWEMADELLAFDVKENFTVEDAVKIAGKIGLDVNKFREDMQSEAVANLIQRDINLGMRNKVEKAPAVFVNEIAVDAQDKDKLVLTVNTEIKRIEAVLNSPTGNYYLSSILHQELPSATMTDSLGRPVRGAKNALVTIVEYSDYQCPFCSRVEPTLAKILKDYPAEVRIVFNHNPLPFHTDAKLAHQAAYAAGKQGRFWEMHDMLFENQKSLKEADLMKYAHKLGLDMDQFTKDLKAPETVAAIDASLKNGEENGISGTPNFLINGEPLTGAQPYEKFKEIIDGSLEKAKAMHNRTGLSGEALYQELIKAQNDKPRRRQPIKRAGENNADAGKVFVDISGAPVMGDPNAPITLVEFTDFQCPFCSRANTTVHELMQKNPGKVKLVFKNNPLSFHQKADGAHRAAEAAALQGKFWEMYDKLFANQKNLDPSDLEKYAGEIGLNMEKFKSDMESDVVKNRVAADLKQSQSVGVRGTPHFFMNGTRISGAQPLDKFQEALDKELKIAEKYQKEGVDPADLYKTIIEKEPKPIMKAVNADDKPDTPKAPIVLEQGKSYAKGPANAPVVIYQFSEFQCPFCNRVEPTMDQIVKEYGDKVRIVFKNFPLPFHNNAALASEAALAAGAQNPGKFWEMHDIMFQNQKALELSNLIQYAGQIGLDVDKFKADLENHTYKDQVDVEIAEGKKAGVSGTPSFVINGKFVVGALPFDKFKAEIDAALAAKK